MAKQKNNVLTEDFLFELYNACMTYDNVCALVCEHMKKEYLPGRDFQGLLGFLQNFYREHKAAPTYNIMRQIASVSRDVSALLDDIADNAEGEDADIVLEQFEIYIRQVKFQRTYKEIGELYVQNEQDKALKLLKNFAEWENDFSLRQDDFVDVGATFRSRFKHNREEHNSESKVRPITRFYIDELDERNGGQDLRGQLTCFLASTGVGKSHLARWVGSNAAQVDGYNVLHVQLEGSQNEVLDAYSASLVRCNTFRYSTGTLKDIDLDKMEEIIKTMSGTIKVKAYPKFDKHVSTLDIRNDIQKYKKIYGQSPDIIIIDSMDLLTDASGRNWSEKGERFKRTAVANDLKDLAADENVWIVVTYQATIENKEWLNDESNVLTEYNCAEAKGLSRPMTHLITLNQSANEEKENTMRINVAKSRFFKKGEPFKIATNYDLEQFYDRVRTMNINKVM